MTTLRDKLIVNNKELEEMSKISMSANESRQKKELHLKVSIAVKLLGHSYTEGSTFMGALPRSLAPIGIIEVKRSWVNLFISNL